MGSRRAPNESFYAPEGESLDGLNLAPPNFREDPRMVEYCELLTTILHLDLLSIVPRSHTLGALYAHLPSCGIDWAKKGDYVCRVVGMPCCGEDRKSRQGLIEHLLTKEHLEHEERAFANRRD